MMQRIARAIEAWIWLRVALEILGMAILLAIYYVLWSTLKAAGTILGL